MLGVVPGTLSFNAARWNHPRWGLMLPEEFIGIAEEAGVIDEIGLHVMEEACRRCHEWQMMFPDQTGFTVSVSPWRISLSSTRTFRFLTSSNAVILFPCGL